MDMTELKRQSSGHYDRHPWETTRARIIDFLLRGFPPFNNIADIGSGDTYVLQSLQKKDFAHYYTAVDTAYTEESIHQLKENGATGIHFFRSIREQGTMNKPADLVLLLDVLEHCSDDRIILKEVVRNESSAKDALFVITVPALNCLFSQHDTLLGHYRRYNRKQLIHLCKQENLDIIRSGYFFITLLPVRLMIKIMEKTGLKKTIKSIDNWKKGKLVTNFISLILWLDFRLCHALSSTGINIPGLSCYCVCQKPLS